MVDRRIIPETNTRGDWARLVAQALNDFPRQLAARDEQILTMQLQIADLQARVTALEAP